MPSSIKVSEFVEFVGSHFPERLLVENQSLAHGEESDSYFSIYSYACKDNHFSQYHEIMVENFPQKALFRVFSSLFFSNIYKNVEVLKPFIESYMDIFTQLFVAFEKYAYLCTE